MKKLLAILLALAGLASLFVLTSIVYEFVPVRTYDSNGNKISATYKYNNGNPHFIVAYDDKGQFNTVRVFYKNGFRHSIWYYNDAEEIYMNTYFSNDDENYMMLRVMYDEDVEVGHYWYEQDGTCRGWSNPNDTTWSYYSPCLFGE